MKRSIQQLRISSESDKITEKELKKAYLIKRRLPVLKKAGEKLKRYNKSLKGKVSRARTIDC